MRVSRFLAVVVMIFSVLAIGMPTPALANHEPTVVHQPPPVAKSGIDLRLPVVVDGCTIFCSPIVLEAHYRSPDGRRRTIRANLGSLLLEPAVLVVPAVDVSTPRFRYRLEARQDSCLFDVCHEGRTRAPAKGLFSIAVL